MCRSSSKRVLSRTFNVACCGMGLLLLAPALIAVALAIKLNDGGPVFYFQRRIGRTFGTFSVLKFRTMRVAAESSGLLTTPKDERVTAVGRFLRTYKIDELPQLINVLRGEMQLVGPRPEVERYVEMFRSEYEVLLQEPPGLTDPASFAYIDESNHFSNAEEMEKKYVSKILPDKLKLSLEYQRNRSFFSDVRIIFRTLRALFSRRAAPTFRHSYN